MKQRLERKCIPTWCEGELEGRELVSFARLLWVSLFPLELVCFDAFDRLFVAGIRPVEIASALPEFQSG